MSAAMTTNTTPSIYVRCLASYNAGVLHGAWVDVDDIDQVQAEIASMLQQSPIPGAEEYAIHDYSDWHGYRVDEYHDLDELVIMANGIAEHGPAFAAFITNGHDPESFENAYMGEWDSVLDYVDDLLEDVVREVPQELRNYVDYEAYARDLELGGDIWTWNDGWSVHIFSNHY